MMYSLKALKGMEEADMRRRAWWPKLCRISDCLIILRPVKGNRAGFAQFMREKLLGFYFDQERDWWEAPLTEENYHAAIQANVVQLNQDRSECRIKASSGVMAWLRELETDKESQCYSDS